MPVGYASASLTLNFSIAKGIIKILFKITRNKKKKHDNILMLAKSKLSSIEILISKALNDVNKSHKEFTIILNERDKYDRMKYKITNENENKILFESCMYLWIKMESYSLKCKKYTKDINPQVSSTSNGKLMILSQCAICNSNKSKFINKQEAKGLLSKLGIKTPLGKIPILGDILF